jgi:predicted amidohydrolase YtcJ
LAGRTVIPGVVQTHYHLYNAATRRYGPQFDLVDPTVKVNLVAESTPEATARKIRETVVNAIKAQQIPKGQWISVMVEEGHSNLPGTNRTWFFTGKIN